MSENPAEKIIEDFFNNLQIKNHYYSIQAKQPIFLVGEKELYEAIKKALESDNNQNPKTIPPVSKPITQLLSMLKRS